jgi:glucose/arabinose dehydrogenase
MKTLTIMLGATALLSLAACNSGAEANDQTNQAAPAANETAPADANATKPTDGNSAAPAGDAGAKPTDGAAAPAEGDAGSKPTGDAAAAEPKNEAQ